MTIERIDRIKDYRIFKDYRWPSTLPDFARYNLIYGWNGSGKTTLSYLFLALQKKTSITNGDVRFCIDGNELQGTNIATTKAPSVRVFNRDTVHRTLFEESHQELPPVYYLGEDSADKQRLVVELKETIESKQSEVQQKGYALTEQQRLLEKFCIDQASTIKTLLTAPGGGNYNNFNKGNFRKMADSLSAKPSPYTRLSVEEYNRCLETKNGKPMDVIAKASIPSTNYVTITQRIKELLLRSVTASVLEDLLLSPKVTSWVQTGLALHTGEHSSSECRFCKQALSKDRLEALNTYFSDELNRFQQELDQEINSIELYKNEITQYQMPSINLFYPHLQEKFGTAVEDWPKVQMIEVKFLESLSSALKRKRDEPFKQLDLKDFIFNLLQESKYLGWSFTTLGAFLDNSQNAFTILSFNTIKKINQVIDDHNRYTAEYATQVEEARNLLAKDLVVAVLKDYQAHGALIEKQTREATRLHREITEADNEIIRLEVYIKQHRKAAEELNAEMSTYLGRDELRFEASENGYQITRNGQPAMHLSEGERTAISFMYFLKTLEDENFDLSNGIVVIDDPISSLDSNSLYCAFGFMKEKAKEAKQLFVLTHNFSFFRLVRGWFSKQPGMRSPNAAKHSSRYYLLDSCAHEKNRSSKLCAIDPLLRDYESEYHFLFKKVYKESQCSTSGDGLETYYGLPNVGRRLLESFLTFKLPNFEAGKLERKMDEIKYDPAKKARILRFLHVHSHNDQIGAPEHDLSVLSETPAILADLMDLIKTLDQEHYEGMKSLILSPEVE